MLMDDKIRRASLFARTSDKSLDHHILQTVYPIIISLHHSNVDDTFYKMSLISIYKSSHKY
jgi:hypothetical protein